MEQQAGDERRAYWTRTMEQAHAFMRQASAAHVQECGEPLGSLVEAASAAGVEVEFSSKPHAKGHARVYLLRRGLIAGFVAAARAMNERGWVMRVEDGYRTREMQKYLAREPYVFDVVLERVVWELEGRLPPAELVVRRLGALVAGCPKVGTHMSGSAIDISVLDRSSRAEVDRGGAYLELSELTPMDSPFVAGAARANRVAITALMEANGFVAYPWEFWHYNGGDVYASILRPHTAARYGAIDVDPAGGGLQPIDDPEAALNSLDEIYSSIQAALERLAA